MTFLSAHNVVTASDGNIIFYDAVTCQVRKLAGTTLSTVSGPSYTARAHFGNTSLLGFDGNDHLVFANQNKWLAPPNRSLRRCKCWILRAGQHGANFRLRWRRLCQ